MKALPDKSDKNDAAGAPAVEPYSSQSDSETAAAGAADDARAVARREKGYLREGPGDEDEDEDEDGEEEEEEGDGGDEDEENCGRRHKPKRKHKKHHHKHHDRHEVRKKHKKHRRRVVEPIFLWAQNREAKIVRVVCEDYDPHNRLRLVKTGGVWTSNPRSRVQLTAAVAKSRSSSRHGDGSQRDTDWESTADDGAAADGLEDDRKATAREQLDGEQVQLVDLNDNSIDFVDAACADRDDGEADRPVRTDRAPSDVIERDPASVAADRDVKVPLAAIETAGLRLPEGTTIHQVKTEDQRATPGGRPATGAAVTVPPTTPAMTSVVPPLQRCTFGELTIISQQDPENRQSQHLQNEPLNLEAACKRPALEIRLQEQPFKKKRVERPPQQRPAQQRHQRHQQQQQQQQQQQPPPPRQQQQQPLPPPPKSLPIGVKREWGDPLSELKEVLSDPRLSVPDPLLVPKARLAALVASPATEIPRLLQQRPPDPDLLTVSLSHLQSILLQQHADEQREHGNIDHMMWLSYLSSCKDVAGADADLISSMLSLLLPPAHNTAAPGQQPYGGYGAQQQTQWNDLYYAAGNLVVPSYGGGNPVAGYSKSDDFCSSPLLPPQHQQQQPQYAQSLQKHHQHQQKPPAAKHHRGACPELQCCNGASPLPPQPSTACYDMCCAKAGVCGSPFAVQLSPAGCGGGGGGGGGGGVGGNIKAPVYTTSDGAATPGGGTCCFPAEMGGCTYGCHQPSPVQSRKHLNPPQASPARNRTPYGYPQTGLGQHHQLLQQQLQTLPAEYGGVGENTGGNVDGSVGGGSSSSVDGNVGGGCSVGGEDAQQTCLAATTNEPQTPPVLPSQPAETASGGDAAAAPSKPLQKAKIKVKQHLIDPNAKPKLLNIEGALHLAGASAHDLLTSPLWHPLFGSQEKRYGCRWQWTTPVTTSASTISSDTSGTR